jgi:hypothetical protein
MRTLRLKTFVSRGASYLGFQRVYQLQIGTRKGPFALGAGYIGGATAYLAINSVGGGKDMYRPRLLRVGVTRNANRVPYTRH